MSKEQIIKNIIAAVAKASGVPVTILTGSRTSVELGHLRGIVVRIARTYEIYTAAVCVHLGRDRSAINVRLKFANREIEERTTLGCRLLEIEAIALDLLGAGTDVGAPEQPERYRVRRIVAGVSAVILLSEKSILGGARDRQHVNARLVVARIALDSGRSFAEIGRSLNRDHTTILHLINELEPKIVGSPRHYTILTIDKKVRRWLEDNPETKIIPSLPSLERTL